MSATPEMEKNTQNENPPPKKRGRKRKSEIALQKQLEEIIVSAENTPREETLSRRGRPRKKVNYYELANPENLEFSVETQKQIKINLENDEPTTKRKKDEKNSKEQSLSPEKLKEIKMENLVVETNGTHSENGHTALPIENQHQEEKKNFLLEKDISMNYKDNFENNEASTSTPNALKDKKYNYTGETVKMMNTLFTLFANNTEEQPNSDSVNSSSNDISPPLTKNNKRGYRKSKKVELKEEEIDDGSGNVTCAICNTAMDKNLWSHHKQRYHNNLAWRIGDPPLDLNDQSLVMHTLNLLYKKKKPLYCDKCGEFKKSVVGFLSHRSQCLKSEEQLESVKVACEICGRKMLPVSMSTHMKMIHQNSNEKVDEETPRKGGNDTNKPVSGKRSAARKAMRIIENVTKTDNKDKYFTTNVDLGSQEFAKILLQKELDETQFIECKFRCNCITTNMEDALKHFEECSEKPPEGFVCKQCLLILPRIEDIIQHVEFSHEINVTSVEDNDDSNFVEKENKLPSFLNSIVKRTERVLFPFAFEWTYKFCEENYSDILFKEFSVAESNWPLLPPEEVPKYLPSLNESCNVARVNVTSFINPLNRDYATKKFNLFETEIQDDNKVTLFCGGPISCIAWLPTPHTEENFNQVLAVSVLRTPDVKYETYENYSENSAIQFWNFGKLCNKENSREQPKLAFTLVLDHGPVWHMEWCPSGCYNPSKTEKNRMGLLAVAGSDSIVYVYSIPFFKEEEMGLYYKPKAVIKLLLQRPETPLLGNMKYYPTKMSWSKCKGHGYIAAGYTNGFVALFNLTTNSVMLKYRDIYDISCILPSKCFQAHSHAITAISLYHLHGGCRWLLTGSIDRGVNLWDLDNYSYPICHLKKNTVTDGFWLTNWLCYLTTFDEASTSMHVTTMLKEARDYLYDPNVTLTCSASTITTVTGSDWLNGVLHGNSVGEIVGIFPHQLFNIPEQKVLKTKRLLFGFTYLLEKNKTPQERVNDDKLRKKTLQNLSTKKMSAGVKLSKIKADFDCDNLFIEEPILYEDAEEKYSLLFCDNKMQSYMDFPKDTFKQLTALSKSYETMFPNQYPLTAINKIVFNPNRQASLYYATGYQAGFVRISWMEFLKGDNQIK